ncbi:hypothetical protein CAEBREN_09534 [Caenorhabditis brenneri]|uniref:Uncharacterized protein n=1 Tax=Caenorhabditis brenneri TaxID=135651 RepID=G0P1L2_CAEBE|nr:hypothetical protein CAEBREN_09534 [Caenorhabditis brenneri]
MSGLPPPNAIQPQPNATEALRAALAVAQQAAGEQANAVLPQASSRSTGWSRGRPSSNGNLGGLGGIYQPQRPLGFDIFELMAKAQVDENYCFLIARDASQTEPPARVAPILDKVAGAATQYPPPNLAQTANERHGASSILKQTNCDFQHQAYIMQSCIEATTQKFLEASAAKEERIITHVERIVAAFTAPAITSQSAAAQDAGIVASQHVAAPEVAAQHVAAPEVVRRRNVLAPVGDAGPPLTRKRAAEANRGEPPAGVAPIFDGAPPLNPPLNLAQTANGRQGLFSAIDFWPCSPNRARTRPPGYRDTEEKS